MSVFFRLVTRLKHGSSYRGKLYRNDVKGNKNYFKLAQCSSYRKFELPREKLQLMYEGNAWESYFGLS